MNAISPASVLALFILAGSAIGHPVPRANHDRAVALRILPGSKPHEAIVRVDYRLEVDELTVILDDMRPFVDEVDAAQFKGKPLGYYGEYMRLYAPIIGSQLRLSVDGKDVELKNVKRTPSLKDEEGKDLGHLRCDFVYEAPISLAGPTTIDFREGAYLLQEGEIRLTLDRSSPWTMTVLAAPTEESQRRPLAERAPGDDDRLRELRFRLAPALAATPAVAIPELAPPPTRVDPAAPPAPRRVRGHPLEPRRAPC